jgi:mannosyltransferase OCH1-like enzyme
MALKFHFDLPPAYFTPIPKIIHSSFINMKNDTGLPRNASYSDVFERMPSPIQQSMRSFSELNPNYSFRFISSLQGLRQDIIELEGDAVLKAFDQLVPLAFKIDLWRLVVLYHYGGNAS